MKINSINLARSLPLEGQRGFAVTAFLVGVIVIISVIYTGISYDVSRASSLKGFQDKAQYMVDTSKSLNQWYERNAWAIDSVTTPIPSATIATQAGISIKYGAVIVSSQRLAKNNISYHVIAFWLPQDNLTGTNFDVNTGVFTEGTYLAANASERLRYTIINGSTIESNLINSSFKTMSKAASSLETWFAGRGFQASTLENRINSNWFRSPSCVNNLNYLPCTTGYQPSATVLNGYGIVDGSDSKSAWGRDVLVTNDPSIVPNVRPYSLLLAADTPWGRRLVTQVTQPSNNLD